MNTTLKRCALATAVTGLCLSSAMLQASSHREAPFITEKPKVDGTDFYMFRSYDQDRDGTGETGDFVTLIANYLPLQSPFGGPNYFDLDEDAIYEIHIDWSGDGKENLTFQFDFENVNQDLQLDIDGVMVSAPLKNIGQIGPGAQSDGFGATPFTDDGAIATRQEYTLRVIQGDRRTGSVSVATNVSGGGGTTFRKPMDNIGERSIPNYDQYAGGFVHEFSVSNCQGNGKVFVGQRRDAFAISLGEIFDLANLDDPFQADENDRRDPTNNRNDLENLNVTSLAVEVPTDCLTRPASQTASGDNVIGGWTTASIRQAEIINPEPTEKNFDSSAMGQSASIKGGAFTQVSRLGMPLTNEVVIGLKDKDRFNHSKPENDGQFIDYVTNPTLPTLLEIVTDEILEAPDVYPREDLIQIFLTGVTLFDEEDNAFFSNKPVDVAASEMLRLNTTVDPVALGDQADLGPLAGDLAGFPNGRRPIDDVVDIALRAATGAVIPFIRDADGNMLQDSDGMDAGNPNEGMDLTDRAFVVRENLLESFPYLGHPLGGSPFSN